MPNPETTYTYRDGRKVVLHKEPDQFVIRTQPEQLESYGFEVVERVSPASARVTTTSGQLEASMGMFRQMAPTHHAYTEEESGEAFLITDRILVTFAEDPVEERVDSFAAEYALVKLRKYSARTYLFQLTSDTGMNPVKLVVRLMEHESIVELAEHDLNMMVKKYEVPVPVDPYYNRQWHLHERLSHPEFDPRSDAACEAAWQALDGFGSQEVVVGITDDGCLLDHPDFDSFEKFAGWGYFVGNRLINQDDFDADPDRMYIRGANHGTAVAGVIGGEVDATHTVGAAPGCRLLPIKWESSGPSLFISDSKVLDAVNYVADKVDILSNSWGASPVMEFSRPVLDRIRELARSGGRRGKGILFLWAAGNENCPIEHASQIPIPYTSGWQFLPDGSRRWVGVRTATSFRHNLVGIAGVMHIAALASTAKRSHYSNYGTGINLTAPSSNGHTYGRLAVEGLGIITATGEPSGVTFNFGGTSSATPLVAGVAALVISANPALSALEVESILEQTAAKDLDFDGYPRTPPASYDRDTSWDVSPAPPFEQPAFGDDNDPDGTWSPWFGHGCVDAFVAVTRALSGADSGGGDQEAEAFSGASSPGVAIPDNSAVGVSDRISCQLPGTLRGISVGVDIRHSYRGDLVVRLIAPSGRSAVLHDRNGGSANDLTETFGLSDTPNLALLVGEELEGDWTLQVEDRARIDTGTLEAWSLELRTAARESVSAVQEESQAIPDNDAQGIRSELQIAESGAIASLEINIDITHTYIGDLQVRLRSPQGTAILLHNRSGGSADNIIRSYATADTPALAALSGESFQGTWTLEVNDSVGFDTGKLNRWGVRIERE